MDKARHARYSPRLRFRAPRAQLFDGDLKGDERWQLLASRFLASMRGARYARRMAESEEGDFQRTQEGRSAHYHDEATSPRQGTIEYRRHGRAPRIDSMP